MEAIASQTIEREKKNGYSEQQIRDCWNSSTTMYEFQQKLKKCTPSSQPPAPKPKAPQTNYNDVYCMVVKPGGQVTQQTYSREREDKVPCGLMNLGSTCYFNSLFQTYFFNFNFVQLILEWKKQDNFQSFDKKVQLSIELVAEVQTLIIKMIGSDEKYLDTVGIMGKLFEVNGANIFEQHDVAELNDIFLTRLQEGLYPEIVKLETSNPVKQSILESSQLHKTFFGKFECSIGYESLIEQKQQDTFNLIPINVQAGNLELGLKNYMGSTIEGDTKNGQPRIKKLIITDPPEVLQFHIQRVTYSTAYAQAFKVNNEFFFEKEIDIGQYCKPPGPTIEEQSKEIEAKLEQIQQKLNEFQSDKQDDIIEQLKRSIEILDQQVEKANQGEDALITKQYSEPALLQLTACAAELQTKKKALLDEQKDLQQQLTQVADKDNQSKSNKQCIYKLQSIIIHQGQPQSGHYFDLIYDFKNQKWYQLNDMHVKEELEGDVLALAYGTNQALQASAYLLVYVNQDQVLKEQHSSIPIRSFRLSQYKDQYLADVYGKLLTQEQKQLLNQYNTDFKKQPTDRGENIPFLKVIDLYSQYFDITMAKRLEINAFLQNKDLLVKPPLIQHFVFFAHQYYIAKNVVQWILLDYALKELNPNKQAIYSSQALSKEIQSMILNETQLRFDPYSEKCITYTSFPLTAYQCIKQQYVQSVQLCYYFLKLTEAYLSETYIETLQLLQYLVHQSQFTDVTSDFFTKMTTHYCYLIPLGILYTIFSQNNRKRKAEDIQVIKLLTTFALQIQTEKPDYRPWNQTILNIIKMIAEKHPQQAQLDLIAKQFYEQKLDQEASQKLENLPNAVLTQCCEMMKIYNPDKFIGNNADNIFEPMVNNLELISQQLKPKTVLKRIQEQLTTLSKSSLLDLF